MPVIRSCHMTSELFIDSLQSVWKFYNQKINYTEFQELFPITGLGWTSAMERKARNLLVKIFPLPLILTCDQLFFFHSRGKKKKHTPDHREL